MNIDKLNSKTRERNPGWNSYMQLLKLLFIISSCLCFFSCNSSGSKDQAPKQKNQEPVTSFGKAVKSAKNLNKEAAKRDDELKEQVEELKE